MIPLKGQRRLPFAAENVVVNPGSGPSGAVRLINNILPDADSSSPDSRPCASQHTRRLGAAATDAGRPCLACGSATVIVAGGSYSGPVERCTECGVSRALPSKSRTRRKGARS
jgi:hypothetical protein